MLIRGSRARAFVAKITLKIVDVAEPLPCWRRNIADHDGELRCQQIILPTRIQPLSPVVACRISSLTNNLVHSRVHRYSHAACNSKA
jgi:hypothetical protein